MATTQTRALSVLVVDDCRDGAESLAILLRLYGHETRVASDRATALQIAENFTFDVAFIDIGPAGGDGFDLARSLRRRSGRPPLLIAVSSYGGAAERRRCEDVGFEHYFLKPLDPAELEVLLRSHAAALGPARRER